MKKKLFKCLSFLLVIGFTLSGCSNKETADFFAMDTIMRINLTGKEAKEAARAAKEEIAGLDKLLDVTDKNSGLFALNTASHASGEIADLAQKCVDISRPLGGTFDITMYPISKAWGFTTENYRVPSDAELKALLKYTGWESLAFKDNSVYLPKGFMLDFGAAAKGYGADKVREKLKSFDIKSGVVSLGGTILVIGKKSFNKPFDVAIQSPVGDGYAGYIGASDTIISTSGGYERYFTEGGKKYHHIIDPSTGKPSDSGLLSVTVVTDSGLLSDALSTALFVMGEDDALSYWRKSNNFEAVLVTGDKKIIVTEGLSKSFTKGDLDYKVVYEKR
ncbi:MAG: FAD:protein FMN transferase [Bacillota bacterium]|nr:FAD:protein FMN transferase [Bacillota bacterium]